MLRTNKAWIAILKGAISAVMIFTTQGCLQRTPVEPNHGKDVKRVAQNVRFLQARTLRLGKIFDVTRLVNAAAGDSLIVGDDTTGYCRIVFQPGDLDADAAVTFWWDSQNFTAEFGPHGLQFNQPVTFRLSYKDADLTGVPEDSLKIWYYDDVNNVWEIVGDKVNKAKKYVEGVTTHFSRYAIGSE